MPVYDDAYLENTIRQVFEDPEHYKLPRGVLRYDYAKTHGWWVRVTRDKAHFRQLFSDGVYGSVDNALRLALVYRHQLLSSFPMTIQRTNSRNLPSDPEQRVFLQSEPGAKQPYVHWLAKWYDEKHKIKTKSFSVLKFGHAQARSLALAVAAKNHNRAPKKHAVPDLYEDENWRSILRSDVEVLASISSGAYGVDGRYRELIEASTPFGYEGERCARIHMSIERDKTLRAKKLAEFLELHGRMYCELCTFNFLDSFPFLDRDIIEVHHILPLSMLLTSTRVETTDLMLLCSNCHTAIHQGDAVTNLALARQHFATDPPTQ